MKNTLVVVADLASLKAYKLEAAQLNRSPRLELIDEFENVAAHEHVVERVSDSSGRFPRGANGSGLSAGERHNMNLELRKRLVRQIAQRINALGRDPQFESCLLAASKEINPQLVAELEPGVRAKIGTNLAADLTKLPRAEILGRF
jgi:hypothetical protein